MLVATSTAESTRRQAENVREYAETGAVSEPHWVHYQLWWYEGLAFMNLHGITESRYKGTQMQQTLGMLLDELTGRAWRQVYGNLRSGYYLESLRRLLRDALGAYVWAEFTIGFSWRAYRALDFYLKLMSKGMAAPRDDAWYLLNATLPWDQRAYISPEEWWKVSDLLAVGQREAVSEWYLELTGHALVCPAARNRMARVLGHVVGGATSQRMAEAAANNLPDLFRAAYHAGILRPARGLTFDPARSEVPVAGPSDSIIPRGSSL